MDKFFTIVGAMVVVVCGILALSFLLSWPVYMLWNGCLVDAVTGVKEITWLQGWGISALSGLLIKSTTTSSKD
jgi:hypothetical protein